MPLSMSFSVLRASVAKRVDRTNNGILVRIDKHNSESCKSRIDCEVIEVVTANLAPQIRVRCGCGRRMDCVLPRKWFTPAQIDQMEKLRLEPGQAVECQRCHVFTINVEQHHVAPRQFFEDSDEWPTIALCQCCHVRWHQVMNARVSTPPQTPQKTLSRGSPDAWEPRRGR